MTDHDELGKLELMLDASWLREDETSLEEIDAQLSAMGLDPEDIEKRGARTARRASMGALDWRAQARQKIQQRNALLEQFDRAPRPTLGRGELLEAIERARLATREGEAHISTYFRSRTPEVASNEELQGLLQDLELLHALRDVEEE